MKGTEKKREKKEKSVDVLRFPSSQRSEKKKKMMKKKMMMMMKTRRKTKTLAMKRSCR